MKKVITAFIIFLILLGSFPGKGFSQGDDEAYSEYQVIPDEAIRLRILANSDQDQDQELKRKIRDAVNAEITKWVEEISDIDKARQLIQDNLPEIEQTVKAVLAEEGSNQSFNVEYGSDVNFPTKVYGSYVYPAGEYEAILISLGEAQGANWWCVLFPPLCFLDFSNGSSVADEEQEEVEEVEEDDSEEEEEVKVKFFFLEWFL